MEELERAQDRLANIRTVRPIVDGLRTISLGSWQAATRRKDGVQRYAERLQAMLPLLLPHLPRKQSVAEQVMARLPLPHNPWPIRRQDEPEGDDERSRRIVVLVVGSERGLCGQFNTAVAERFEQYLEKETPGPRVELMALGSRVQRALRRREHAPDWTGTLSVTALPPFSLAFDLTQTWLKRYEHHKLDAVDLIHNTYRGTGNYEPTVTRLIPPPLPTGKSRKGAERQVWPPPIIETDPLRLYARVVEQWAAVQLYNLLLDSAAAEHSTRFQLMESASQNIKRLIEELTLVVQTARQKEITQEMQELAAGAGLIGPGSRKKT